MTITEDLENFYDSEAAKYHQTRQKFWADGDKIIGALNGFDFDNPRILELGCGGGRGAQLLNKNYEKDFQYTGVDLSQKLLNLAKKDNQNCTFIHSEMNEYLMGLEQESIDVILAFASFQHLSSDSDRIKVMRDIHRVLKYGGAVIFTNWAYSKWFLKKYWKRIGIAGLTSVIHGGKSSWRDVMIPWDSDKGRQYRYYHLFSLEELKKITNLAGLAVEELHYLDKKGEITENWENANNSFLVATKTIYKN